MIRKLCAVSARRRFGVTVLAHFRWSNSPELGITFGVKSLAASESTGDYEGSDVLRFYLVDRAMVRVKVTWLKPKNFTTESHEQYAAADEQEPALAGAWDKYLNVSKHFAFELSPKLSITHGFSGSGKFTVAMQINDCDASFEELCDRIRNRGSDPSETTINVLKSQMSSHDPLTEEELQFVR